MASITVYEVWTEKDKVGIRNSAGRQILSNSPSQLLEFLRYSAKQTVRVFWDLDESIAPILKTLPLPILDLLVEFDNDTQYCNNQMYYLPDRMFRVGKSRFYSIKQFWPTKETPPTTLKETQDKANELARTLGECGMADFFLLTSPIAVFEKTEMGKKAFESIPKGHRISAECFEAIEYASRCDRLEWISAHQVGHWQEGEIWDYDVSGMYPSVASDLLNLYDMDIWKSSVFEEKEIDATYGFLRGKLWLDPVSEYAHCSPIMTNIGRIPGNPVGDFGDDFPITLDELRFVEEYGLGKFTMTDGWFLAPKRGVVVEKPFYPLMGYLYRKRDLSQLASSVMKGVANQIIGKLIETRVDGDYGAIRNDIYHSIILAKARVKVAVFLIENKVKSEELIVVQTDGVRLTRDIPQIGNGMGSWRCNGSRPTIVASPYRVYVDDKKPGHLTYGYITEMIKEHPLLQYYERVVGHRTTLRDALVEGKVSSVGQWDELPAYLDLSTISREQNRDFAKLPKTGDALLGNKFQSNPIVI